MSDQDEGLRRCGAGLTMSIANTQEVMNILNQRDFTGPLAALSLNSVDCMSLIEYPINKTNNNNYNDAL